VSAAASYTLLIVESPVIARIIQQVAPSSVYVLSTNGYAWKPVYDAERNQLKEKADPDQLGFRKELKQQASWAGNIIIATDPDPSGDFIAWSICKFLKNPSIKRSHIQHLGRKGIERLISSAEVIQTDLLELRLKNRSLIRHQWNKTGRRPSMEIAALSSTFSSYFPYKHFADQKGRIWNSNRPIQCATDEWIQVQKSVSDSEYHSANPLSTFDLLQLAFEKDIFKSFANAQETLQQLFTHTLDYSEESLISYPRTSANSYFSETWASLQQQFLQLNHTGEFKPMFIRNIAGQEVSHESLYPISLTYTPEKVGGELLSTLRDLYDLIYHQTLRAITIPSEKHTAYQTAFHQDVHFYSTTNKSEISNTELLPIRTVSEIGLLLSSHRVLSPSSFGEKLDRWISQKYLELDGAILKPGKYLAPYVNDGPNYANQIEQLFNLIDEQNLKAETIATLLS
jgi:DNA topoisomerase IA